VFLSLLAVCFSGGCCLGFNNHEWVAVLLVLLGMMDTDMAEMLPAGAVFEASLPPDLADMYRRLAVLLPQAPVPLVMVLQLWGCTDPQEAQENIQIFVMQVCPARAWLLSAC